MAYAILDHLQIAVPDVAIIEISEDFTREFPEASIQLGSRRLLPEAGMHFGSKYPGNPDRIATYDLVPDQILTKVHNVSDFLGALVFDKWVGNSDGRQSIFFRALINEWFPGGDENPRKMGFVGLMIDNGYAFNGPHWDYVESPLQGLYPQKSVYHAVHGEDDFQPWLDRVVHFPDHILDEAMRQMPPEWLEGDKEQLEKLLDNLLKRRKRVPYLIADARLARKNPFVNWPT